MSDTLGDGTGHPTAPQLRLYERWADGGVAVSIVGEVQASPLYPENPGNLVLDETADLERFRAVARRGGAHGAALWVQLGHAGALAYPPTSAPKGPSALDLPGLQCAALTLDEIREIPAQFARAARLAQQAGFGGVQVHAAHGFLLSQFLSPLFNMRNDAYGGPIERRMRLLLESVEAVRAAVGPTFPIAVKLNSSDQLEGGLSEADALKVVRQLDQTSIDLIDISGGTYFPGARAASDGAGHGPYFIDFARRARAVTTKPLMLTGGIKTRAQAEAALASGACDVVGLARALVLEPSLPDLWRAGQMPAPEFPRFAKAPPGGITAWYTLRIRAIAEDSELPGPGDLQRAIDAGAARNAALEKVWLEHFAPSLGCRG
ncbi:MAG: oxidoreductase [Alphaproteobacteria bacterium]|nr:MAG: oxidoreductase [Alphaproteobacteria bacterium]